MSNSKLFPKPNTIRLNGKIEIIDKPKVMGILNLTPDSFYDGGKYLEPEKMLSHVEQMIEDKVFIVDVGCQSSRPGAIDLGAEHELKILIPALKLLCKTFPNAYFSVDTYHSKVANEAICNGAHLINDISGGQFDKEMFDAIAKYNTPYILMHTQGKPENMQQNPVYSNVIKEIEYYFSEKLDVLNRLGISDVILDVGFGFGKTIDHNYELLSQLEHFSIFNRLMLVGISRKSMIYKHLNIDANDSLSGTTALNMVALQKGADILRVHDVKDAQQTIELFLKLNNNQTIN